MWVTVGGGGTGAGRGDGGSGANGGNSSFGTIVAYGGGGGAYGNNGGGNGGSGGGTANAQNAYGLGTSGQGNNGGISADWGTSGGGGGGAVGGNGNSGQLKGGDGGTGYYSTISGTGLYYGGGGGGWGYGNAGNAGAGGGGRGGTNGTPATAATANTGGGGGGGGTNGTGTNGASGIVILAWTEPVAAITSPLSATVNQGQTVSYTITASGNPTSFGATGLPSGLSVNTANGVISGTIPSNGGTQGSNSTVYSTITATNVSGTGSATLTWAITAASITTNASVSPSTSSLGSAITLTRDGSANFGVAWTENTIWKPDGSAQALGNMALGSANYTPAAGPGTYYYQFRVVDGYANFKDQWVSFTVNDASAPSTPVGLTASNITSYSFNLSWTASTDNVGVTGYEVFRNGTSLGTTASTSFSVTGLALGTNYSMTVRARDAAGNWSAQSAPLSVTTSGDTAPPSVPASLTYSGLSSTGFTLSWAASTDNVGVTAYEVLRNGVSLGTTASLSMTVTGLSPSTGYSMTVRARDAAGNWSAQSSPLNVTTPADTSAPSAPAGLSASGVAFFSFTLSWGASSDNVGVSAYEIFRDGVSLGTTGSLSANITGLSPNTTYAMTVRARDAAGNWSPQSAPLNVTTPADTTPPSTPSAPAAGSVMSYSVTLSWPAATDNVGVTAYEVFRDGVSQGTTTTLSLNLTSLTPGTTYSLTIRARDAAGNWSAQSSALNVTTAASFEVFTPLL